MLLWLPLSPPEGVELRFFTFRVLNTPLENLVEVQLLSPHQKHQDNILQAIL